MSPMVSLDGGDQTLTGTTVSPSIFHAAEILGKEETVARLRYAISQTTQEDQQEGA